MMHHDIVIIGGGPAGLAAAVSARRAGVEDILILERDNVLGGILNQCIHNGFGLHTFKEELTGPEYAARYIEMVTEEKIPYRLNTMVIDINSEKEVTYINREEGLVTIKAGAVILAMGCREKTRAGIQIPGTRPAGVYTAGAAQRLINRQNAMVGREVVILGSGDIGMIMARRMSLEGAHVKAVVEIMDFLAGLTRNKVQCLDDFDIPLKLSHTVTRIVGNERVEGVYVAAVDENKKPILETEEFISCDTLLLSVGLLPENELTRQAGIEMNPVTNGPSVNQYMQTSAPGVFACGNVVHVNDLVDNVTTESMQAGACAARYAALWKDRPDHTEKPAEGRSVKAVPGANVRYLCPQSICLDRTLSRPEADEKETVRLFFRVLAPDTEVKITAKCGEKEIKAKKALRVNPGEMESIEIPLHLVTGDVTVEIEKEA